MGRAEQDGARVGLAGDASPAGMSDAGRLPCVGRLGQTCGVRLAYRRPAWLACVVRGAAGLVSYSMCTAFLGVYKETMLTILICFILDEKVLAACAPPRPARSRCARCGPVSSAPAWRACNDAIRGHVCRVPVSHTHVGVRALAGQCEGARRAELLPEADQGRRDDTPQRRPCTSAHPLGLLPSRSLLDRWSSVPPRVYCGALY